MESTRLPGKALLRAAGKTMLEHTVERLSRSRRIDRIVVATTREPADDAIADVCSSIGVDCFRGSADDVLGRVFACASECGMTDVAHFGADNPLIDPAICDEVIGVYLDGGWEYVTNNFPPSYPDGEEVEVTSFPALERVEREATKPHQREHFLTYIWENPQSFLIRNVTHEPNLHHLRWTLDTPQDWDVVGRVFEQLYGENPTFGVADIVALSAASEVRRGRS